MAHGADKSGKTAENVESKAPAKHWIICYGFKPRYETLKEVLLMNPKNMLNFVHLQGWLLLMDYVTVVYLISLRAITGVCVAYYLTKLAQPILF